MKQFFTRRKLFAITIFLLGGYSSVFSQIEIIERPIEWNQERLDLTVAYQKSHYGISNADGSIIPKIVVLHWTVIPTMEDSFRAFNKSKLPSVRDDIAGGGALNVSAHYLVDRDGTIYHLLSDTLMARHTIGLNQTAIGIENVGGTPDKPLTKEQLKSNIELVKHLSDLYDIEYVIGHYEYTLFEEHPLWLEQDKGYRTQKTDPGPDFMKQVRKGIRKLNLKGAPLKQ
jgi:N-acetylmuramoyl-L-alanine amidase